MQDHFIDIIGIYIVIADERQCCINGGMGQAPSG